MALTLIFAMLIAALAVWWRGAVARNRAANRLDHWLSPDGAEREHSQRRVTRSFPPRHRFGARLAGVLGGVTLWMFVGLPIEVSIAAGALIGVLMHLIEENRAEQQIALIEAQLAAAIYLMVGSLRAGASLLAAFESALTEVGAPLRPYFQEVAGRIRLGDDPRTAVTDLQLYVPLETFRLFAASLSVHWEVGGSLATTLSSVGQTIRDRIELSRRVRAQAAEAQASVAVVLVMAYALAFLMWRTNPDRIEAFAHSTIGVVVVALVISLQAIGLIWISRLNRSAF